MITFSDALSQLPQFVSDTPADFDTAYDWMCEMTGIRICDDTDLWHKFWNAYYDAATWEQINDVYESV